MHILEVLGEASLARSIVATKITLVVSEVHVLGTHMVFPHDPIFEGSCATSEGEDTYKSWGVIHIQMNPVGNISPVPASIRGSLGPYLTIDLRALLP